MLQCFDAVLLHRGLPAVDRMDAIYPTNFYIFLIVITVMEMRLYVWIAMVNGKFSTPQLSLEYMERGLRTAIAIAEPVEQPVVVTAATNEVSSDYRIMANGLKHDIIFFNLALFNILMNSNWKVDLKRTCSWTSPSPFSLRPKSKVQLKWRTGVQFCTGILQDSYIKQRPWCCNICRLV